VQAYSPALTEFETPRMRRLAFELLGESFFLFRSITILIFC
jgi:hypothetical protein